MRLTLRTMLAYMDDILEPTDAEDIRKKMEDSKFASELAQRIRDSVRMLRLPAPPLQGRGLGLDANSVAKYLDNELPGDRVADFEKICLESDKHLAEVASCHQILTLVLGEPADVDPVARERMYGLIDHQEPIAPPPQAPLVAPPKGAGEGASVAAGSHRSIPQTSAAASAPLAEPAAAAGGRRAKPEVPDYLREKHASRIWPVAAVMLVAFVLTAGVFWMIAPPEWRGQALSWFGGEPAAEGDSQIAAAGAASDAAANGAGGDQAGGTAKVADKGSETSAGNNDASAAGSGDAVKHDAVKHDAVKHDGSSADGSPLDGPKMAAGEPTLVAPDGAAPNGAAPDAAVPDGAAPTNPDIARPAADPAISDPASVAGRPAAATPAPGALDGASLPGDVVANSLPGGGGAAPGDLASSRPDQMPDAVASSTPAGVPVAPGGAAGAAPIGPPGEVPLAGPGMAAAKAPWHVGEEMGRYTSEQDVLLKRDTATRAWKRLPPKSPIVAGDFLLSLPAYRPVFNLMSGVNVQAVGPSEFAIRGIDAQGVPTIAIRYGRLIALTIGKASNQIRLEFGERSGLVTFGDTNSTLAIEVDQLLTPGVDPETEVAPTVAQIFATSGSIRWEENGQPEAIIQAPAGRTLAPLPIAELAGAELPKWVSPDNLSFPDKNGAEGIEKELTPDRPISLAIKELAENRRIEIRTLATRCAGYVGQFEPSVASFNNADQHTDWPKHIEALRAALARGPETAAQVHAAFEKHRGPDAAKLYRMLWGYTPEQLKDGAAQQLVEDLNSDSLDIRVLSFWNLQSMTGLSLFYKPEYSAAKRRPAYMKWKERWKEGKLFTAASAKVGSRAARPPAESPER